MEDLCIFIPTFKRWEKQWTLSCIPEEWMDKTFLVIDKSDIEAYKPYSTVCRLLVCPHRGIHKVRQWIMGTKFSQKVLFMSDDLSFYRRSKEVRRAADGSQWHPLEDCSVSQVGTIIEWFSKVLDEDGYAHAALSARQFNRFCSDRTKEVDRAHDVYGYRRDIFRKEGIRFDRVPLMEDIDVTLQLLRKGYPNIANYHFCWNQSGSNTEGGCSTYRNAEKQADCAYKMEELHKGFVTVVDKKVKGWPGMSQRKDLRVQWQKAYEKGGDTQEV